jgi:hypothetical protein
MYGTSLCCLVRAGACPLHMPYMRMKIAISPSEKLQLVEDLWGVSLWDNETGLGSGLFPDAWLGQGARRGQLDGLGLQSKAGVEPRGHAPAAGQPRLRLAASTDRHYAYIPNESSMNVIPAT